ncbi:MAG TPA: HAMP domain-containing sensor histidine kinase [Rhizomicrobium sp.]|nr:HAMP domain-containing sensor histidine kinase [Rhizomicrobium sp.]
MPTIVRLNQKRYLASGVDLTELFDQIPQPIAYFDANNRLGACNLSFRDAFPVVIESEFLKRASIGPASNRSNVSYGALTRFGHPEPAANPPALLSTARGEFEPHTHKFPDGGTLLVLRDVKDQQHKEDDYQRQIAVLKAELAEAQHARQDAIDTARIRKDFLTATSHELRTPLNAMLGFSEILTGEMFGPMQNDRYLEYAKIIHQSGVHVLSLINDLLDLSKLDAGKLELCVEPVQILKVIIDCVRSVEPQATRDQVGISIHVYDGVDQLCVDNRRLHQMLLNLLSNALKFTPAGGEIMIEVFKRGPDIAISVSDTGIGIRAEDIPKVLEPFGQVDSMMGQKHKGTGLGLPLTKELAELHGGSLTMESNVDAGTTVTITLPRDPADANPN